jgi:O-antigen/teichoic acid export membrane protein
MPSAVIIPIMTIVLFKQSGYKINFNDFGTKQWKEITKYTKHIIGSRVLTKLVNEGDTLLVGKLLGMEALGIYDIAFKLANIFNQNLLPIITNISMPVFALNQTDKSKVREYYNKMISVISFVFIPVMFWLLLNARFVILKLYGSQWEAAVLPAQIFMLFALFRSLSSPTSGLYNAMGKPQISLYFSIIYAPIFFLFLIYFSKFGLIYTCVAVSALRIAGSMFHFFMGNYLLENRIKSFINLFYPILTSVLIVVVLILYFKVENVFLNSFVFLIGVGLILIVFFRNYLQNNIFQIAQSFRLNTSNGKQ